MALESKQFGHLWVRDELITEYYWLWSVYFSDADRLRRISFSLESSESMVIQLPMSLETVIITGRLSSTSCAVCLSTCL